MILLLLACAGAPDADAQGARPVAVAAAPVRQDDFVLRGTYAGELASDAADLAARVSGRLARVDVRIGDPVRAGQELALVDDASLKQSLAEARAQLRVAEATLVRARTDAALAEREAERLAPLAAREIVSARDAEAERARAESARAEQGVSEARLDEARARVARAEQELRDARIVAPFDGVVAERWLDPGAMVSPGTAVLRVVASGPPRVRFRVPDHDLAGLAVGLALTASAAGVEATGRVERISGEVSRADRSVAVEGALSPDPRLRPGMFAQVRVDRLVLDDALVVPGAALLSRPGTDGAMLTGVFVVEGDAARWVPVELLGESGDRAAVSGAVPADGAVLVMGHESLKDGARVRVTPR